LSSNIIYQAFWDDDVRRGFLHSHSYTGNPLACRAALATLDIFDTENTLEKNRQLSAVITSALQPLATHPSIRNFRNTGMIWAMDVDTQMPDFSRRYFAAAMARGLLVRPIGNTVYLMPPYVLSHTDAQWVADQMSSALNATLGASS
jgi:adenosylmethionine-8-amino-7-oxononanoate aminotransferase